MLRDTAASAMFQRRSDNYRPRSESIHTDLYRLQIHTPSLLQLITLSMEIVESSSSSSLSASDRIHQLPGQPQVSYQQFSGYVTVNAKKQKALVLEAESNSASKPLVIWLNGGPGCSSLGVRALSENGPFRPSGKALVRNGYSWNRVSYRHHKSCRMRMFPLILSLTRPSLAISLLSAFCFYH